MAHGHKAVKVLGMALATVAAVATSMILVYRDNNLHAEERLIAKAYEAGFFEKQAEVDGSTINYAEGPSNGPALLLIHGQGVEWEDYASALPELAKRYHVFVIDCFGHGESAHDPALYSCAENGNKLIAFVISLVVALVVIAIAWLFYRPVIGITLLVAAVGLIVWLKTRKKKPAKAEETAAGE
jgi:hypothetical protein